MEGLNFTFSNVISLSVLVIGAISGYIYTKFQIKQILIEISKINTNVEKDFLTMHSRIDKHKIENNERYSKLEVILDKFKDEINRVELKMEQNKNDIIQALK